MPNPTASGPPAPATINRRRLPLLIARIVAKRMDEDGIFQQAAALAYNTLFSLLPIFVIALLVTSLIGGVGKQSVGNQFENFIFQQTGLNQIHIVDSNNNTVDLADYISGRLELVRKIVQSPQTGIIGFATLFWGAISLMMVIERAFSRIYRARKSRTLVRRLLLYWCVLTLGPLGVAASLWLTHNIYHVTANVSAAVFILEPLRIFAGYVVSFSLLLLMYRLIPDAPVKLSSAAAGAVVGTILWELGKYLFGLYVAHFVGYGKWYGTLGLVPLFMFWIYLMWNFVLLGLEIAYIHQNFPALARRLAANRNGDSGITDVHCILALAALLTHRFDQGKGVTADAAADELRISVDVAGQLLKGLKNAGLAHTIDGDQKIFVLARPPANITAEELLASARLVCRSPTQVTLNTPDGPRAIQTGMAQLHEVESAWARTQTMRSLADGGKPRADGSPGEAASQG